MADSADGSPPTSGPPSDANFIVHQVECSGLFPAHSRHPESAIFLDHPRMFQGDTRADALRGRHAVESMPHYLEQNPGAGFVVYRTYSCTAYHEELSLALHATPGPDDQSDLFVLDQDAPPACSEREHMAIVADDFYSAIGVVCATRKTNGPWQDHEMFAHRHSDWDSEHNMLAPYLYFYHSRELLRNAQPDNPHYKTRIDLLLGYIDNNFGHEYSEAEELFNKGYVTRKHIHKLFGPNQILVTRQGDHIATVMTKTCPLPHSFPIRIDCERWSFDGRFARSSERIVVHWPSGQRQKAYITSYIDGGKLAISALTAYPLKWASSEIQDLISMRGEIFWQCQHERFISYEANPKTDLAQVNGRYMIDMRTYQELHGKNNTAANERDSTREYMEPGILRSIYGSHQDFLLLLPPTIVGFSFDDKRWRPLAVENIREIEWSKSDFDELILDSKVKEVFSSLLRQQLSVRWDARSSRRTGLIVLLHGGPGTGKTRSAEAVTELLEVPLYRIASGDIGLAAEDVERNLETVFHLANVWNAVILLDNFDLFLERSGRENMQHGAAFSVMIRALETYKGALVLTTNRVNDFDRALMSRVRLTIHLPSPDETGRLMLWRHAIRQQLKAENKDRYVELDGSDVRALAVMRLNGNEIQNAVRTARQLATDRGESLKLEHIEQTLKIMFDSTRLEQLFEKSL